MQSSVNGGELHVPLIGREISVDGEPLETYDVVLGNEPVDSEGVSSSTPGPNNKHSIGFGALVFLIYYNIGVPFGDEEVRLSSLHVPSVFCELMTGLPIPSSRSYVFRIKKYEQLKRTLQRQNQRPSS